MGTTGRSGFGLWRFPPSPALSSREMWTLASQDARREQNFVEAMPSRINQRKTLLHFVIARYATHIWQKIPVYTEISSVFREIRQDCPFHRRRPVGWNEMSREITWFVKLNAYAPFLNYTTSTELFATRFAAAGSTANVFIYSTSSPAKLEDIHESS